MKIQCDVCDKDQASVFCEADEAALCTACDHRVHHANKLAGKHRRFSLHQPSAKQSPLCDICQERRAFLFCQEDRAILCRECDISIHKANELTQSHSRFLLTGLKLSSNSISPESHSSICDPVPTIKSQNESSARTTPTAKSTTVRSTPVTANSESNTTTSTELTSSSISEYLIETLPGWHVEDFLLDHANSPSPYSFSKNGENDVLPFWDASDDGSSSMIGSWIPQVMPSSAAAPLHYTQNHQHQSYYQQSMANGGKELLQFSVSNNTKSVHSRKKTEDPNYFAVPQITPTSNNNNNNNAFKRSRTLW